MERDWFLQTPEAGRQLGGCGEHGAVREISVLFIGRCRYRGGKGVDKKEARGRVMQETGSACCNCEEDLTLQCCPADKGGSGRVTLEKSLNCGVNYLL